MNNTDHMKRDKDGSFSGESPIGHIDIEGVRVK